MPERRFLLTVAVLFAMGAVLVRTIHVVHAVAPDRRRRDWIKYGVYIAIINGLWASAYLGQPVAAVALGAIVLVGTLEIWSVVPPPPRSGTLALLPASAALLIFGVALYPMVASTEAGWQAAFGFVVMVTASVDSFAELTGRLFGRRRLWPVLSPGKTLEGLVGGLTLSLAVALSLGFMVPNVRGGALALLGLMTALGGVAGDLAFSALKRGVGVKDFSGVLPGHGGVLDRFDSLLVSAPVFYVVRAWLSTQ
jgi:phosphatidate cytidylyltransferase